MHMTDNSILLIPAHNYLALQIGATALRDG